MKTNTPLSTMTKTHGPNNSGINSRAISLSHIPLFGVTLLLALIIMSLVAQPYLHIMWDSFIYMQLAENLLQKGEYTYNGVRHIKYPPGLPLALAGVIALFGKSYYVLRLQSAFWGLLIPLFTFLLLQRAPKLPPIFCFLGGLLCLTDISLVYTSTTILSDLPFCSCLMGLLVVTARFDRRAALSKWEMYLAASLCIFLSCLRVVCLAVSLALLIKLLLPETPKIIRKQLAVLFICSLTPTFLWLGYSITHAHTFPFDTIDHIGYFPELLRPESATKTSSGLSLIDLVTRVQENIEYLSPRILDLASNHSSSLFARLTLGPFFVMLFLLGQFRTWRRAPLPSLFLLSYLPLVLLWGAKEGHRFLLPCLPIAIFYSVIGAFYMCQHRVALFRWIVGIALIILVGNRSLLLPVPLKLELSRPYPRTEHEQQWIEISQELASHLTNSDRFIAEKAPVLTNLSGKWGIALPWPPYSVENFARRIAALKITHVVMTEAIPTELRQLLLQTNAHEIHKGSNYSIYRVNQVESTKLLGQ